MASIAARIGRCASDMLTISPQLFGSAARPVCHRRKDCRVYFFFKRRFAQARAKILERTFFMRSKIGMITLGVADLARSLAFYRDGLGFPTHNYAEDAKCVMFALDGSWLSLYPRDLLAQDADMAPASAAAESFPGFTLAHNEPTKEDVDRVFALAIAVGARLVKPPQATFWGGYSGYFADPDDFLWEIAFNPFIDLT
jgi:uncharacterized protein